MSKCDLILLLNSGITHWQSPYMHAYFPALNSPASLLGDMLADAIGSLGFTWV
jgi:histidine decarboxylase